MHFVKALIGLAVATVSASKLSSDVSFTNQPEDISISKPFTIRYKALDMDQPVKITLLRGAPKNVYPVGVLASSVTGGSYKWTPSQSLVKAADYGLQIDQGDIYNWSGDFAVVGEAAMSSSSMSSSASLSSSTASRTSSAMMTTPTPMAPLTTTIVPSGTGSIINMPRNTTFSMATLSPTTTGTTLSPTAGGGMGAAGGMGGQGSGSGSGSGSQDGPDGTNGASSAQSQFALVLVTVAAIAYLI